MTTEQVIAGAEPRYVRGGGVGVLLLHDLGGTPQMVQGLAETLAAAGFTIDVPLLPGHGTHPQDLSAMSWDDWAGAAQLALDELASRTGPVVVVGIGVGATLGCWAAAMHPQVAGVVAINPRSAPVPADTIEMLRTMQADGSITDRMIPQGLDVSDTAVHVLEYESVPVSSLLSVFEALDDMKQHWNELTAPLLVITSAHDHHVAPYNSDFLARHAGGKVDRMVLDRSFHLATIDVEHREVEDAVVAFTRKVTAVVQASTPS